MVVRSIRIILATVLLISAAHAMVFAYAQNPAPSAPASAASPADPVKLTADIAARAIESARADVEVVKWIFTAFTAVFTTLGGLLAYFGFKSITDARKHFQDQSERNAQELGDLRKTIARVLHHQEMVDGTYNDLAGIEAARRRLSAERKPENKQELDALVQKRTAYGQRVMDDLQEIRQWLVKIESDRWMAWLEGVEGVTLLHLQRFSEALDRLDKAVMLARRESRLDRIPLGSHLYNLACCHALKGEGDKALQKLEEALNTSPWLRLEARKDAELHGDFQDLAADPRFHPLVDKYDKRPDTSP